MPSRLVSLAALLLTSTILVAAEKPHVVFIAIDDLNMSVACFGHPRVKTPNVDRLAARGVRFDRAYCNYPVCNPSRTSFMTGLRPETTQILDNKTPFRSKLPDVVTLPQLLRDHGYFTARVGKVFHDGLDDPKAWAIALDNKITETGKRGEGELLNKKHPEFCYWVSAEGDADDQQDSQTARDSIKLIKEHKDKPFFIAVGLRRPHDPWIAPKKFFDMYPPESIKLPDKPPTTSKLGPITYTGHNMLGEISEEHTRQFIRAYYACISFMDSQLGRVLDILDSEKLWDNTLVIFVSDHGWQEGTHGGLWLKATLFEEATHVPLIVVAPGKSAAVCTRLVELVDLYPTIAQLTGVAPPENLEGTSFVPLLDEPKRAWKSAAFTVVERKGQLGRSIRTDRYRYTAWPDGTIELYDLQTDPHEYKNLAQDSASSDKLAEMKQALEAGWRAALPQ